MDTIIPLMNAVLFGSDVDRAQATERLQALFPAPGFIQSLSQLLLSKEVPPHFRQLSGTLLRDACRQHWMTVDPAVQGELRRLILPCIAESDSRLRTSASSVVAAIAKHDFPERWPELIPQIREYLMNQNEQVVSGSLRCFQMISEQLADNELVQVLQTVSPVLLALFSAPTAPNRIRARSAVIFHKLLELLGMVKSEFPKEADALLKQILPGWLPPISAALASSLGDDQDYSVQLSALRVVNVLVQYFSKGSMQHIRAMLPVIWQLLLNGAAKYEENAVFDANDGAQDSDGDTLGVESLATESIELLLTLMRSRLARSLHRSLTEICSVVLTYMQITQDQEDLWSSDPNQFVADDEDDTWAYSPRTAAVDLFDEMVEVFGNDGLTAVVSAASAKMQEAAARMQAQNPHWWKLREAAELALGTIADELIDQQMQGVRILDIETMLRSVLVQDLDVNCVFHSVAFILMSAATEFLRGRALWLSSRLAGGASVDLWGPYVGCAVQALSTTSPIPVRVSACRALAKFCPRIDKQQLAPLLPAIIQGVAALANQGGEELLTLVLEVLTRLAKLNPEVTAQFESALSVLALSTWSAHSEDATLTDDAVELMDVLAANPMIRDNIRARCAPAIMQIMQEPEKFQPGMLHSAVDLLTRLVQHADSIPSTFVDSFLPLLIHRMQDFSNASVVQNGCETLRAFIKAGKETLLQRYGQCRMEHSEHGSCNGQALPMIVDIVVKSLQVPSGEDHSCVYSGLVVVSLLQYLPNHMMQYVPTLLSVVVERFLNTRSHSLALMLCLVFAQLGQQHIAQMVQFLAELKLPSIEPPQVLVKVLQRWMDVQGDMLTLFRQKLSLIALTNLIALGNAQILQIPVKGELIAVPQTGVRTRRQAAKQPDQFTQLPLIQKILQYIAEALVMEQEEAPLDNAWSDDSDDNEDDEEAAEDKAFRQQLQAQQGRSPFAPASMYLSEILDHVQRGGYDSDDDMDESSDPLTREHPVNKINLQTYLVSALRELARTQGPLISQHVAALPPRQRDTLVRAVQEPSPQQ